MTDSRKPEAPKCPMSGCGARVDRPKCLFELGGDCPRHEVLDAWKAERRSPIPAQTSPEQERDVDELLDRYDRLSDAAFNMYGESWWYGEYCAARNELRSRLLSVVSPPADTGKTDG